MECFSLQLVAIALFVCEPGKSVALSIALSGSKPSFSQCVTPKRNLSPPLSVCTLYCSVLVGELAAIIPDLQPETHPPFHSTLRNCRV